jgi:hypothetical protein
MIPVTKQQVLNSVLRKQLPIAVAVKLLKQLHAAEDLKKISNAL